MYSNNSSQEGCGCVLMGDSGRVEGQGFNQIAINGRKPTYNKFTFLNIFRWDMTSGCNFLFKLYSLWNKNGLGTKMNLLL